jgi:hypothetical protein
MSYKMPVLGAQEEKEEDQIAAEINALEGVLPDTNQTLEESLAAAQDYDPYKRLRDQATRRRVPASDRYQSYVEKLTPMFSQSRPTGEQRFYDLASDLGSSLLSADPTEGVFRPLGRGFGNFNERLRKQSESERAINQSVAMKAFELAMADEKAAADYLNQIDLAIVKHGATPYDPLVFEVDELNAQGEKTGRRVEVLVDPRNEKQVEAIQNAADRNPKRLRPSGTSVNIDQTGETTLDVQRAKNLAEWENELFAEAKAGRAQENLVDTFMRTVASMEEGDFGVLESATLTFRKILNEIGLFDEEEAKKIDNQTMIDTLGTRIAMGLVGQTKGAISEMEMKLFIAASPGLLSTKTGAMRQAEFLKRIAERAGQRSTDFVKAVQEGGLFDNAEASSDQWLATMAWSENWYKQNPFFTPKEKAEMEAYAAGESDAAKILSSTFFRERESGGPGFVDTTNMLFNP